MAYGTFMNYDKLTTKLNKPQADTRDGDDIRYLVPVLMRHPKYQLLYLKYGADRILS